jgi:hypothetical protein
MESRRGRNKIGGSGYPKPHSFDDQEEELTGMFNGLVTVVSKPLSLPTSDYQVNVNLEG